MIKPAQLYLDELNEKYVNTWYDDRYKFFFRCGWSSQITLPDNNYNSHDFVSVDPNDNVIGYMHYQIDRDANSCDDFGLISFDPGNVLFIRDVKRVVDDIFLRYNINRITWTCFEDNPAIKAYRCFIRRFGGVECGRFREDAKLSDGKRHNSIAFEILQREYRPYLEARGGICEHERGV